MAPNAALVRQPSAAIVQCELTFLERVPIDVASAERQHAGVCAALRELGIDVAEVPPAPDLPDAVFIEDTAVVLDEVAVLSRPGAESRRPETAAVAEVLGCYRRLERLTAPATLDGGDVLVSGRQVYVGRSQRTNDAGIAQLRGLIEPHGYEVTAVLVTKCLHFLSACSVVGEGTVLANPEWVDPGVFAGHRVIPIDPSEPYGANTVRVGDTVLASASHPKTNARLEAEGLRVCAVAVSEFEKAEGGVSCLLLLV